MNDNNDQYEIIVNKMPDIINMLNLSEDNQLLMESIITGIETTAAEFIRDGKIAQLPAVGCIRKDPIKKIVRDNHTNFKIARLHMDKEQYKEHVKGFIVDAKKKLNKADKTKEYSRQVRTRNRKKYDKLYASIGREYAEMYIHAIMLLSVVEYDQEVQDAYDKIYEHG